MAQSEAEAAASDMVDALETTLRSDVSSELQTASTQDAAAREALRESLQGAVECVPSAALGALPGLALPTVAGFPAHRGRPFSSSVAWKRTRWTRPTRTRLARLTRLSRASATGCSRRCVVAGPAAPVWWQGKRVAWWPRLTLLFFFFSFFSFSSRPPD